MLLWMNVIKKGTFNWFEFIQTTPSIDILLLTFEYFTAWHLRLRQYYPGQEVINEHNDPNLAETPHYKEKQTILPHPISIEGEKKPNTPIKRSHDGKIKKDKKDLSKSPMIDEQSSSPKEVCVKSEEAKIDMRKLIIEHKLHNKTLDSNNTASSLHSPAKKHSTSSSLSHNKKEKDKNKSSSSNDSHRSHSSSKKSQSSDKHRRDENRKSSSSSNHSSSIEKHKTSENPTKKVDQPKPQTLQPVPINESTPQKCDTPQMDESNVSKPVASSDQVTSSHSIVSNVPVSTPPHIPCVPPTPVIQNIQNPQIQCTSELQLVPPMPAEPPFDVLPPLPDIPPPPPPPPPPPIAEEPKTINQSNIMPDSSTQQTPQSPAAKARKLNNGDKTTPTRSSDLLGSIMASMDSPRNASGF